MRKACWWSIRVMMREPSTSGRVASSADGAERVEHRGRGRLHRGGRARVELEVAELALDHQDARLDLGVLQRDVGQPLDVEARRHLDDLGRHPRPRQPAAHPGRQIGQRLGLQLVEKDEGPELGHARSGGWGASGAFRVRVGGGLAPNILIPSARAEFFGDDAPDLLAQIVV
jgi:hypothetical protein